MEDALEKIINSLTGCCPVPLRRALWLRLIPIFSQHDVQVGEFIGMDIGYDMAYDTLYPPIDCTPERLMIQDRTNRDETQDSSADNRQAK